MNYISQLQPDAEIIIENNHIVVEKVIDIKVDKKIISTDPGHPKYDTSTVISIIKEFYDKIPILRICLEHQAFGEDSSKEYVGQVKVGPMHRKPFKDFHDEEIILKGIPNPLQLIPYLSLAAKGDILPQDLKISAMADDDTIMAVHYKNYLIGGDEFHPESIKMELNGMVLLTIFRS